jgi:hypothetical protein
MVSGIPNILTVDRVWIERHADMDDACDVIVRLEDGNIYTSLFVTIPYLRRQMEINYAFSQTVEDVVPVRFAVLDTPHILVEALNRDNIEDTLDNLLALDVFESLFTRVTEDDRIEALSAATGRRATQEVAAVVLTEVLVVEEDAAP